MRRGAAPDLALVLAAEEAGRVRGAAVVEKSHKLRRFYRRVAAGTYKKPKPRLSYEERAELRREAQRRRIETLAERNHQADTPIPIAWRDHHELQEFLDEGFDWAEAKAKREVKHAITRRLVAAKYDELAAWTDRADDELRYRRIAEKLRNARTEGWWGFDRITRQRYMRFRDRSGLVRHDPSESNRDTARVIRRLVPKLVQLQAAGFVLYKAVFSMPNVPLGRLAWGKAEIFRMMARALEAFPEVVGRFDAQEDPLAIDGQSWNVHVNSILVVDARRCTPLPPELMPQGEINLSGALGKLPAPLRRDRAAPGELSYAKLHYVWGRNQIELRKVEARNVETLAEEIKEIIKYAVKWIGKKHFDGMANAGTPGAAGPGTVAPPGLWPVRGDGSRCAGAPDRSQGPPARLCDRVVEPAPAGFTGIAPAHHHARTAPPFVEWPCPVADEWERANFRTRRVRTYGVLFRLERDELPDDPERDGKLRFCGRVFIFPTHFRVEAARLHHLDLIHGDKSERNFGARPGRSPGAQARAGPGDLVRAS